MNNNLNNPCCIPGNNTNGKNPPPDFNSLPQDPFDSEEMRGSIQRILADNIGEYVVIEFLIGTERIMRKQGLLYLVGTSYVTLFDDMQNNYIICDIFSVKFVYFYHPGERPKVNFNMLSQNANGR